MYMIIPEFMFFKYYICLYLPHSLNTHENAIIKESKYYISLLFVLKSSFLYLYKSAYICTHAANELIDNSRYLETFLLDFIEVVLHVNEIFSS